MDKPSAAPIAFSYVRFSTPEQIKGDSLRRQTAGAEEYCARHGLTLDTSLSLRDLGVSAFKGTHRTSDKHALTQFLKLAQQGRIPAGSFLIVENLDRLSREEERTALRLWMDILDQKIHIVQLHPETVFRHEKSDMFDVMRAIMELSRGHGESMVKSQRLAEAWDAKRSGIGERKLTGKVPFWLKLSDDGNSFTVNEGRADLVRRLFRLAREGHGSKSIAKRLNAEEIPSPYGKTWNNVSVLAILRSRAVVGEFTPHSGRGADRKPISQPVAGYYPAIIGEDEFFAVQNATQARTRQRGRRSEHVTNLFTNLLSDARDGTRMHVTNKRAGDWRLVSSGAMRGHAGAKYVSFPCQPFERAILSLLREIDPREVLGTQEPDETQALSAELVGLEARITELENELLSGDVAAVTRVLRQLEARKRDLAGRVAEARQRAASPLSEAWGETQSLLSALDGAPDREDARLRLRAALLRIIECVWMVPVARGHNRIAGVQVWFKGGKSHRDYVIAFCPKSNSRAALPRGWWCRSLSRGDAGGELDLRKPEHAQALAARLEALDLAEAFPDAGAS